MALYVFSNSEIDAFNSTQRLLHNLAQLSGGGGGGVVNPYNNKKVEQILDVAGIPYSKTYASNTIHTLDITVVQGNVKLAVGTDPAVDLVEGVSIRLDATEKIQQIIQIDNDPALPIHVILTTTY